MQWTEGEIEKLSLHYHISTRQKLLCMFPNRTWKGIVTKAVKLGFHRGEMRMIEKYITRRKNGNSVRNNTIAKNLARLKKG